MRIYNDSLPEPIYRALTNDKYNPGDSDYTPSSLNQPAYQRRLFKDRGSELTERASSRIWALLGTSVHHMIELAGETADHYECERRFYGEIGTELGWFLIGSQIDILDHQSSGIYDMKVTSAWGYGKTKPEWVSQLNVGRWCVWKETGNVVNKLTIVAIWRDWSASDSGKPDYPDAQVSQIDIPIWSLDETERWIREKVTEREVAMRLPSLDDVEPCSDEDVWAKPTKYAVTKPGAARAMKVFDVQSKADELAAKTAGAFVEVRPGARTRCSGYCAARDICPAYQAHLKRFGGAK